MTSKPFLLEVNDAQVRIRVCQLTLMQPTFDVLCKMIDCSIGGDSRFSVA